MNSVDDGMAVLDHQRVIVAANEAFARRFPAGAQTPIGRPCCGDSNDSLGCVEDGFCPALACFITGTVQTAVKTRTLPDGSVRHEEVRTSPVFNPDGTVTHVVEVWRDITDRRSAEAKLAETQRMVSLGMLASGFSHEVNTPLGSIEMCLDNIRRLCAELGASDGEAKQRVGEYVRIAGSQVQRAGAITEQFLMLSRGQSLPAAPLNLASCAQAAASLCRHKARDAGVTIDLPEIARPPTVVANESAVQQVLINLMMNAIDACERGAHITVSFEEIDGQLNVRVADQGRGIPREDQAQLFEPFFSRRAGGTGLGLFVSLNLARGWGGDITVESRPGEGSTFTVGFPVPHNGAKAHGEHQSSRC
ncbi:MAG: ATP-binding protein [Deltaproteobacteria bacterium]|nr:ATP-binding protein [Deltaproteobacteria bacterium]